MSHTNTTIYIDTTTTPHTGISVADVGAVLGRGAGDVGLLCSDQEWYDNNGTQDLRRVNKINQWAKSKPMRINKIGIPTTAEKQDAYYGLYIPIYGTNYTSNLTTFLTEYEDGWIYLPPRGKGNGASGADEWFRLLDFDGYCSQARSFIYANGCTFPSSFIYNQGAGSLNFELGMNPSSQIDDYNSILITDLVLGGSTGTANFSQLYFALLFMDDDDSSKKHLVTSSTAVGNTSSTSTITITEGNDGLDGLNKDHTYTVYPVLSASSTSGVINLRTTDVLVALPLSAFSFEQHTSAALTNISFLAATAVSERGRITVTARLGMQSSTGGLQTISQVHWTIYSASSNGDTTGTQIATGSVYNLTPSSPQVFTDTIMSTSYTWLRLYAVADGHSDINTTRWVQVKIGGDDPLGPPPID